MCIGKILDLLKVYIIKVTGNFTLKRSSMRRTMGYIGQKQLKKLTKAISEVWVNQKLWSKREIDFQSEELKLYFVNPWLISGSFPKSKKWIEIFSGCLLARCSLCPLSSRIAISVTDHPDQISHMMNDDYTFNDFYSKFSNLPVDFKGFQFNKNIFMICLNWIKMISSMINIKSLYFSFIFPLSFSPLSLPSELTKRSLISKSYQSSRWFQKYISVDSKF